MPRVCGANSTDNTTLQQVAGNKADTATNTSGSTASLMAYMKGLIQYSLPSTTTGSTDIDVSAADYTGYILLLTIAPAGPLIDLVLDIDLNKATTGFHAVATAADTIDFAVAGKIDGTNIRGLVSATQVAAATTPAISAQGQRIKIGDVAAAETIYVYVKVSAERGDTTFPFRLTYRGAAPTVTVVTKG